MVDTGTIYFEQEARFAYCLAFCFLTTVLSTVGQFRGDGRTVFKLCWSLLHNANT